MNYSKTTVMGEQKNILENTHYTSINKKVAKSIANNGIIKARTIINVDGTTAASITKTVLGIVLYEINVSSWVGNDVVIPVLTYGTIVVVDYNVPSEHKATILTANKKWSAETADIVGDIIKWQKVFTNEGYAKLTVLVLTDTCFGYVCQNTAIVNDIKGTNTNYIVTESDIKNYLQKKLGLQLKL